MSFMHAEGTRCLLLGKWIVNLREVGKAFVLPESMMASV